MLLGHGDASRSRIITRLGTEPWKGAKCQELGDHDQIALTSHKARKSVYEFASIAVHHWRQLKWTTGGEAALGGAASQRTGSSQVVGAQGRAARAELRAAAAAAVGESRCRASAGDSSLRDTLFMYDLIAIHESVCSLTQPMPDSAIDTASRAPLADAARRRQSHTRTGSSFRAENAELLLLDFKKDCKA